MNLAEQLRAASADPPPTRIDLDQLVAGEDRRRARVRWIAAGCAAAVAVAATITGVRAAAVPPVEHRLGYVFSPDRLPDPATLPGVAEVWPDAVHELPARLPDGSAYSVQAVLGDGRYLVGRADVTDPSGGPAVYETRAGTVTSLAPEAATQGATTQMTMAKVVGDQAVWMLSGHRRNKAVHELWAARLDGTDGRLVAELSGAYPRFTVAGDAVLWEQDVPGATETLKGPLTTVYRVSLSGGTPAPLPGGRGWALAHDGAWLTTQVNMSGVAPHATGQLWNAATGEKLVWTAHRDAQFLQCGPRWCAGNGSGGVVALQRLDGSGYVELPYEGELESRREGRLAVGSLTSGDGATLLIWDRETGRAGAVGRFPLRLGPGGSPGYVRTSDWDPSVLAWRTTDQLVVVDLTAID